VFVRDREQLSQRLSYFVSEYERERKRLPGGDRSKRLASIASPDENSTDAIKFTRALKGNLAANISYAYDQKFDRPAQYRPFDQRWLHFSSQFIEMPYQSRLAFPDANSHKSMLISGQPAAKPFQVFSSNLIPSYDTLEKTECLPRYRYTKSGERLDNVTDWALNKFTAQYGKKGITKDAIFAYCYGVLHDPVYRETYALNLKREFPRIPFYPDFAQWAAWGEALMAMHIGYESVAPWPLVRVETPAKRADGTHPKPVLKSQPELGVVVVDADTQITGIPVQAWDYRLGNRSAIDWVLDQHKEKKPRDPTIAARFNTYRFAAYKESMLDLLARVVRVSVDTVAITATMRALDRSGWP
jgi:predicted helicase